jgi:hypothetical protein
LSGSYGAIAGAASAMTMIAAATHPQNADIGERVRDGWGVLTRSARWAGMLAGAGIPARSEPRRSIGR